MRGCKAKSLRQEVVRLCNEKGGSRFIPRLYKAAKRAYMETPRNLRAHFTVRKV